MGKAPTSVAALNKHLTRLTTGLPRSSSRIIQSDTSWLFEPSPEHVYHRATYCSTGPSGARGFLAGRMLIAQ